MNKLTELEKATDDLMRAVSRVNEERAKLRDSGEFTCEDIVLSFEQGWPRWKLVDKTGGTK